MCSGVRQVFILALVAAMAFGGAAPQRGFAQANTELEEEARIHFMAGRAHYERGAFLEAATEFEAAYEVSRMAKLLYNAYLAYRDGDALEDAARVLAAYLGNEDLIENRTQLEARLKVLKARNAGAQAHPDPAPREPLQAPPPARAPAAVPEPALEPESSSPVLAYVLMGVGAALVVAAVPTFIVGTSADSDAEDLCPNKVCATESDAAKASDLSSQGSTFTGLSYVLAGSGIAAAATGLVLLLLGSDKGSESAPSASLGCHLGGCHGALRLNF